MAEPVAEPPFRRHGPETPASPVVISVPHAGRAYTPALLRAARLPLEKLEILEDRFVDRLVWRAIAAGSTAIVAEAPRAEIDLNREEREIDPTTVMPPPPSGTVLQSPRTRGGLGLIPSRISGAGSIWRNRIGQDELRRRIEDIHRPYHAALTEELEKARARFGIAILLDCHSMPPRNRSGPDAPGLVFGDRHGSSIAPELLDAAISAARAEGYDSGCNHPYAGGYITTRHGRPESGIHALQLEIDRSLYLERDLRTPGGGFDALSRLIAAVASAIAERALNPGQAIAAE